LQIETKFGAGLSCHFAVDKPHSVLQSLFQVIPQNPREPKYSDGEEDNMAQKEIYNSAMKTFSNTEFTD
jgi:hypothetical protein